MTEELSLVARTFIIIGESISIICLISQIIVYIALPKCRKVEFKILTMITVARIIIVASEYCLLTMPLHVMSISVTYAIYMYADVAMICWMFVFSKNLNDKLVQVFVTRKRSFTLTSVLIWSLTLPVGIICPILLKIDIEYDKSYFDIYYKAYGVVKFVILTVNLLFICRIFYVALNAQPARQIRGIIKTCVVCFILCAISSVQIYATDLASFFNIPEKYMNYFIVVNSYLVVAVMIVFVILVYNALDRKNSKQLSNSCA